MIQPPHFLSAQEAREAFIAFVLPGIANAMQNDNVKRKHLHVVALNPTVPYSADADLPVLFEYSIGERSEWEWQYDKYARSKALISWRTGLSSREVLLTKPHLLCTGDVRLWGSAIVGGVVSAASGVQPFFDEMFAAMTSAAVVGEASYYAAKMADMGESAPDWLQES